MISRETQERAKDKALGVLPPVAFKWPGVEPHLMAKTSSCKLKSLCCNILIDFDVAKVPPHFSLQIVTDALSKRRNEVFPEKTKLDVKVVHPAFVRPVHNVWSELIRRSGVSDFFSLWADQYSSLAHVLLAPFTMQLAEIIFGLSVHCVA